jgi:sterol desaturase/sphingolipid hydroxylase (fatty acid hydroxylase superfamily)
MNSEAILGMLTPATYFTMLAIEAVWPARVFPKVRWWRLVGFGFLALIIGLGVVTPLLLPVEWIARHRLLDGTKLGVAGGVIVGLLVFEFVAYFLHRAAHRFSWMWRWMHQMHHAPQRIDLASSTIFHPFEIVYQNVLAIAVGTFVLGIDPFAAGILGYLGALFGTFQHLNVRTPRWLGYIVQRPESHCIHHQLNVHAYNYSNLPLFDMLFGTFRNPAIFEGRVGFAEKASFANMLVGRDVSGGLGDGVDPRSGAEAKSEQVAA